MDRGRARNRSPKRSRSPKDRSRSRGGRDRSKDRPANARLADKRVYISNIPYDVTWQNLKDLFRNEVGEVAFVELFCDDNDKPRGCGIIEFENPTVAKKAIEKMHRYELSGRKIVVKEDYDVERDKAGRIVTNATANPRRDRARSRDRGDRIDRDWDRRRDSLSPQNSAGGWKHGNTYGLSQQFLENLGIDGQLVAKVFISNLDFRVDEKKLREVFRLAGKVVSVDVNKDKDGKSRGHGTVEFDHAVEAVQAISMFNNQELFDRRMHVRMDRLSDGLADLAKNRLPDGLKSIGMGLGVNGQPLVDVAKTLASSSNAVGNVTSLVGNNMGAQAPMTNALQNVNALAAMGMGGMNQMNTGLASAMLAAQNMQDSIGVAAPAGAGNAFGMTLGGLGNAGVNQFSVAASGIGLNPMGGLSQGNAMNMNQMLQNSSMNIGSSATGNGSGAAQFQNQNYIQSFNAGSGIGVGGPQNIRDLEYGYSTSVYSTPSANYNTAYQREKQFGNGMGPGGSIGSNAPSNTCIVSNLPPTATWQLLKTKFRECGEVLFSEMRDKSTGIVRFANERDAERAVKVFDQSRVDGRTVDVRFL